MRQSSSNTVKVTAVRKMPGKKTWLWSLSDQSVQNFVSCGQLRVLSSGSINKLYLNYGQNKDKFWWNNMFHLKNIQMKRENLVSPDGLEWHPMLTLLLTLIFFCNVFWNSRSYIVISMDYYSIFFHSVEKILKPWRSIRLTCLAVKSSSSLGTNPRSLLKTNSHETTNALLYSLLIQPINV